MRLRIVAIGILLLVSAAVLVGQNGNDLYQQGLAREAAGDIQGAIQIFERIVRDFSSNRTLTARALLQLGRWSDLLGQDQSRRYYERVVRDYGDQTAAVAEARKRLNDRPTAPIEIKTPFTHDPWSFALSPDGRRLVFVATMNGKTSLWLHELSSGKQAPIPGTESPRYGPSFTGANPFWSPDGRFIGYFEDQKLKRIPAAGGTPTTLADAPRNAGGAWNKSGDIVFAPDVLGRLYSISGGGNPAPVSQPRGIYRYPRFLADDRQFLAFKLNDLGGLLMIGSLDGPPRELPVEVGINGVAFAPPDRLVYVLEGGLYFRTLDLQNMKLGGSSVRLAEKVANFLPGSGFSAFSVSAAGPVAYRAETIPRRKFIWLDRSGRETGELTASVSKVEGIPRISPDGRYAAFRLNNTSTFTGQAFLVSLPDGQIRPVDFGAQLVTSPFSPVWSPNGSSLIAGAFGLGEQGGFTTIFEWELGSRAPQRRLLIPSWNRVPENRSPLDWQGDFLLFSKTTQATNQDVLAVRIPGDGEPIPIAVTPARELNARFGPGGNWIAYESDELVGRSEIFVQAFPGSVSARRRVSMNGGSMPEWRRDGKELFFVSTDNRLMAAAVTVSPDGTDIEIGKPAPLFPSPLPDGSTYAPAPDNQRFLVSQPIEATSPIIILPNALRGKQ